MTLRDRLNQVTKKAGNSIYFGLGDILTSEINPKYLLGAAMLIGGFAFTNCAANITQIRNSEDANLERAEKDILERLSKFDNIIQKDAKNIQLYCEATAKPKEELGSYYMRHKLNSMVLIRSIMFECTPNYEICSTNGTEHEIAHFIWDYLEKGQKQDILKAIDDYSKGYRERLYVSYGNIKGGKVKNFAKSKGSILGEDMEDSELFAFTIESLYNNSNEPNVVYRYRIKLADSILEKLANVEYRGHKIFKDKVDDYRTKALVKK